MKESSRQRSQGSKSKRHLQRTVSCSWGILQGWHHTARWSDKEESPFQLGRVGQKQHRVLPAAAGSFCTETSQHLRSHPGSSHSPFSSASSTLYNTSVCLCTPARKNHGRLCTSCSLQTCTGSLQPPRSPPLSLLE